MSGLRDERFQRAKELYITVRCNSNENLPVFGDWVRLWNLVDHLVEVDCDSIIVPAKCGTYHVQHLFTPEKDGTT